ncbi:MAG TPA: exosome complex RNA-binding protein Csl4 [Terriglobales bacterium]|nr:exosome complex RNA-binding protein Csl4 [Terriglobales bacterium]
MSKVAASREIVQPVLPGDRLGVIEQFLPGAGTYEVEGMIFANYTGNARIDLKNKRVTVVPTTRVTLLPKEGATVLASVIHAHDKMATVDIWKIDDKAIQNPFTAMLHISSSSPRYERSMSDVCKSGDIIRARVIDMTNRIPQLTTAGRGLGVIKAFCSRCGAVLELTNRRLQCPSCGNIERRRLAEDFASPPRGVEVGS